MDCWDGFWFRSWIFFECSLNIWKVNSSLDGKSCRVQNGQKYISTLLSLAVFSLFALAYFFFSFYLSFAMVFFFSSITILSVFILFIEYSNYYFITLIFSATTLLLTWTLSTCSSSCSYFILISLDTFWNAFNNFNRNDVGTLLTY